MQNKPHFFFLETGVPKRGGGGVGVRHLGKIPKKSRFFFWTASLIIIIVVNITLLISFIIIFILLTSCRLSLPAKCGSLYTSPNATVLIVNACAGFKAMLCKKRIFSFLKGAPSILLALHYLKRCFSIQTVPGVGCIG